MIHTVEGFGVVNKGEIDVFLALSCFYDDPVDISNLISGSSAFSKTSLNIWKLHTNNILFYAFENVHNGIELCVMLHNRCEIWLKAAEISILWIYHN